MDSEQHDDLKQDTEESLRLFRSSEWRQYLKFLSKRVLKLQNKANAAVREGDIVEARVNIALMDESLRQVKIFKTQVLQNREILERKGKKDG